LLAALTAYTAGPDPQADTGDSEVGRTATQRRADALTEICAHALANPDRPDDGGERPHLHVTVSLETLQAALHGDPAMAGGCDGDAAGITAAAGPSAAAPAGMATGDAARITAGASTGTGARAAGPYTAAVAHLFRSTPPALIGPGREPICAETARRLACDAGIIPAILGSHGEPLDIGRLTRTVPTGLRRALILRDGGCRFPGCDRPAGWCDAHHLIAWADGGPTSLTNLALLCARHHTMVHEGRWRILLDPTTAQVTAYRPGGTRHDLTSQPRGPTRGP
ncbi:MAG: HNH endonuclease signature motif containing protein, partial [Micromonosporaceae bacterium]